MLLYIIKNLLLKKALAITSAYQSTWLTAEYNIISILFYIIHSEQVRRETDSVFYFLCYVKPTGNKDKYRSKWCIGLWQYDYKFADL